jgi:hypothetical protein
MLRIFCNELHDLLASLISITMKNEIREGHRGMYGGEMNINFW